MPVTKGTRLGVLGAGALVAAMVAGLLVATQVSAASHALSIGNGAATVGEEVTVELEAQAITDPGLGAWTIDIVYDPSVVSVVECTPQQGGVCNAEYSAGTIRLAGGSAAGLEGDTVLADIVFACGDAEGSSALTLTVIDFADATIGDPQDVDATISNGNITCGRGEPPPIIIDDVGPLGAGLGYDDRSGLASLVGVLAAAGAIALAFGAVRLPARRS